jgi:glutathione S-transferase
MQSDLPILYSFRRCPYAIRARMTLVYAGIKCCLREVDLKNKPAELLQTSPKGTVPVLLLPDNTVIEESLDIMQWAVTQHDPKNIQDSLNHAYLEEVQKVFVPLSRQFKYVDPNSIEHQEAQVGVEKCLQDFETRLCQQNYFSTGQWGLTDIAIFPFIRQCAAVDAEWFEAQHVTKLSQWLQQHTDSDIFARCMQKTQAWQPGDLPVHFPM